MAGTKVASKMNWHETGHLIIYNPVTFETLLTSYPLEFKEDFLGTTGGGPFDGSGEWAVVDVNDATEALVDDSSNGQFLLHLAPTSEAEDAVLYQGNNRTYDTGNGLIFETRVNMAVAPGTGVVAVLGMCGDHNLDKDSAEEFAWFRLDASMAITVETDDNGSNDNNKIATGVTAVAGTYNIFRIDFTDLSSVKFFIDGTHVAASTTFDLSALNATQQQMQIYYSLDKASGTALCDMNIDYVKVFSNRS